MDNDFRKTHYSLQDLEDESSVDHRKQNYHLQNVIPHVARLGQGSRVLEIGPGKGDLLAQLTQLPNHLVVEAFEVCDSYVQSLQQKGLRVFQGDSPTKFLKGLDSEIKYGAVLMIDVLEHIPMDEVPELLREIQQRLLPGGVLVVQVPNLSGLFGANTFFADPTHVSGFNEISLQKLMRMAKFSDVQVMNLKLPSGILNSLRSVFRSIIFFGIRLLQKAVGATPIRCQAHNIVAVASKA